MEIWSIVQILEILGLLYFQKMTKINKYKQKRCRLIINLICRKKWIELLKVEEELKVHNKQQMDRKEFISKMNRNQVLQWAEVWAIALPNQSVLVTFHKFQANT